MKRKIIKIDEDKCNGCGLCAEACHEGAIGMVDGKARLLRDDYCDGLGDCLPVCPTNAISFEEREAAAYDEAAVKENMKKKKQEAEAKPLSCGCPGTHSRQILRNEIAAPGKTQLMGSVASNNAHMAEGRTAPEMQSRLTQWPVQIKLVPVNASYFNGANLLIAADCSAFAYADFHEKFIKNHIALIGCPKLDMTDYSEKLAQIIRNNNIKSLKVVRMEVPCCGGIEHAAKEALKNSGKFIPWQVFTITTDGEVVD